MILEMVKKIKLEFCNHQRLEEKRDKHGTFFRKKTGCTKILYGAG